jgi:hypothetical protein
MRVSVFVCILLLLGAQQLSANKAKKKSTETEPQLPADEATKFDLATLSAVLAYVHTDNETYVKDLIDFAAIPSISALPDHASDVLAAAGWLKQRMVTAGLENVQVLHTEGPQPVVSVLPPQTQAARSQQHTAHCVTTSVLSRGVSVVMVDYCFGCHGCPTRISQRLVVSGLPNPFRLPCPRLYRGPDQGACSRTQQQQQ